MPSHEYISCTKEEIGTLMVQAMTLEREEGEEGEGG
jgi:hypothetical protein